MVDVGMGWATAVSVGENNTAESRLYQIKFSPHETRMYIALSKVLNVFDNDIFVLIVASVNSTLSHR